MSRLLAWMDMGAFPTEMGTEKRDPCEWWGKLRLALRCRCGVCKALWDLRGEACSLCEELAL